jgi:hypothetical protein
MLTAHDPRIGYRFSVTISDAARSGGGRPGFVIDSEALGLGYVRGPLLPLDVSLRSLGSDGSAIELQRGWCRGDRCTGSFSVAFDRLPDASGPVAFTWAIGAVVNFPTSDVPDGAAVDVSFT